MFLKNFIFLDFSLEQKYIIILVRGRIYSKKILSLNRSENISNIFFSFIKKNKIKIDNQIITEVLTVNGVRFSLEDGSWGLIRASSNKPSLVVVTESPTSNERKKKIFEFIDNLLQKTGKVGEYDQKI